MENKLDEKYLLNMFNLIDIQLNSIQKEQFIKYYKLLIQWNEFMNLTAIVDFNEVVIKHFIDSAYLSKIYKLNDNRVIDIGTGAGFPGIPLKIIFPDSDIVLLDSLNKRIKFLDTVIDELDLKYIRTIHGRAEDFGRDKFYREKFDLSISRAVAKLSTLSEYCVPFIKTNGFFVSYKSGDIDEELNMSQNAIKILSSEIDKIEKYTLPSSDIERSLIFIKKNRILNNKYPRLAGKPGKEPL